MVRAGWALGLRRTKDQTPGEYAMTVARAAPRAAEPAGTIARQYARLVYAHRKPDKAEEATLARAWRHVFRAVLGYRLGRLTGGIAERRRQQ